jgi:hypothetical protein
MAWVARKTTQVGWMCMIDSGWVYMRTTGRIGIGTGVIGLAIDRI